MPNASDILKPEVAQLELTGISRISAPYINDPDVIPLWFGEGDEVTDETITQAAVDALAQGRTFYDNSNGTAALTRAIKSYLELHHGNTIDHSRIIVPGATMLCVTMVVQATLARDDEAILVSPYWPNIERSVRITGASVREFRQEPDNGIWSLDIDALIQSITERTRLIYVNSPCNPTGWVMTSQDQAKLLSACRERGVIILADEVYHRHVYDADTAPSFLDVAQPDDPVICVNGFSKAWAMTGWRLGWMVVPQSTTQAFSVMSQVTNTGATNFIQMGGVTALANGEEVVARLKNRYRQGRDMVMSALADHPRIELLRPEGAFYAFPKIKQLQSSMKFVEQLVAKEKVGVSPGYTFGEGNEGFVRMAFALSHDRLQEALNRFIRFVDSYQD